ncbi:MAG: HlyD family secretion protein [Bacteroidetes bacterium]|nr:HlyD family secretion protein [Bacteroidota bacterium]
MDNNTIDNNEEQQPKKKSILFPIILGVIILGGGIYGYKEYQYSQQYEKTDDAQLTANMAPVISRISGYISEVKVKDNQFVKKGDTLIILDNRDQKMLVQQAEAALQTAKNNITVAQASTQVTSQNINVADAAIATIDAQIEAAKVNVWKTSQDLKRYENLIKDHSITQQQYEQVLAAKQTADRQLQIIIEQKKQAQQQTHVATTQTKASDQQIGTANAIANQRIVEVESAKLNLSYTVIVAPESGFVAKVPVQNGQFVQAGAQLFSLVRDNQLWVIANFKETQLTKMKSGQHATIKVDAFPKLKLDGYINSLSPATGSSFSILPPDNASGNFVKVVQRVPVRIDLKNIDKSVAQKLRAGMNVTAEVNLAQ